MANNVYEAMFIFEAGRYSRDPGGVSGQVGAMVEKFGGEMMVSRLWEERRLAYPINGQRRGAYWLSYFKLDGKQLGALERECQLNDNILRVLFIKIDARIADALVSHALAPPKAVETGPTTTINRPKRAPVAVAVGAEADDSETDDADASDEGEGDGDGK